MHKTAPNEQPTTGAGQYADYIVNTVREPLLILNAQLRVKLANHSFYRTFKVTPEETDDCYVYDLGNGQWDIPALRHLLEEMLPQNAAFNDFEVEHTFPSIGHRIMLLNARRIYQEEDQADLILLAIEDVTERKQAEEALRESESRFRTLVEQVKDYAIFMTDLEGRATSWNEGVQRVLGFEEAEFVGRDTGPLIFTPEDQQSGVPLRELEEAATKGSASDNRWMMRKGGTRFWASGVTTGLRDENGELLGFTKVMRDQTERKRAEEALQDADRRKDEFLAILAHELRNPLAPLRTSLELMRIAADDAAVFEEARGTMERQVRQMVRLIDDLLDVSRISRGKMRLQKRRVSLAAVVQDAVETVRPLIDESEHSLSVTLPPEPVYLHVDPARLAQVLSNLLSNAVKYTNSGGQIALAVERQAAEIVMTVKDTGIGIPADMLDSIFEMFTQVDRSLEQSRSGLGIGLALTKHLVEMHGGTIEAKSPGIGRGSEFIVRLPLPTGLNEESPVVQAHDKDASPAARRILVVDDNQDAASTLGMLLNVLGNETRTAFDGEQALREAEAFRPEVVLLDLRMPGLSGYEAARQLRDQPWGRDMVLVALTGYGQEADRRRTQEAGFDHHLVKPVELAALQRLLADMVSPPAHRHAQGADSPTP